MPKRVDAGRVERVVLGKGTLQGTLNFPPKIWAGVVFCRNLGLREIASNCEHHGEHRLSVRPVRSSPTCKRERAVAPQERSPRVPQHRSSLVGQRGARPQRHGRRGGNAAHKWDGLPTAYPRGTYASTHTQTQWPHGLRGSRPGLRRSRPSPVIAEIAAASRVHVRRRAVKAL